MKTGTPVPKRDIEMKASGSGPVITYKLPPEELAKLEEGQSTKEKFLRLRAKGLTLTKIAKELNIPSGSIGYCLRKWGLPKGNLTPEKAQELLEKEVGATTDAPTKDGPADAEPANIKVADASGSADNLPDSYREIAKKLFEAAPVAIDHESDPAARVIAAEVELHRQKDEMIERLKRELAEKSVRISELEKAIAEMENERDVLLQTVEKAVDENHDPVNRPAHYTAGRVECIDAIESATVGLTGGLAYCTGAAIKYLWRWSRKGGVQDLRKARWYIDRLIGELEGSAS